MQRRLSHRVSHHAPLQRLDGPSPQSAAATSFISRQLRRNACAAAADEEVGVMKLPEPSRRVQLNVVANRLELPRIKGELDVAIAREHHGTDGGSRPRTPCCHAPANPFAKALAFLNLQFAAPPRQLGPRFLAKHPRENLSPLGDNKRDEEKLPSEMAERQLHLLTIRAMKTNGSLPWVLSTPWPEPSGVQVESPGPIVRFTPLSS